MSNETEPYNASSGVDSIYHLLADFFDGKGDAALTPAELSVCLEWLHQITQPAIFALPAPRTTARTIALKKPDLTPVKQQIQELLAKSTSVPEKNVPDKDPPNPAQEARPVIVTRAAQTILGVLSNPAKDTKTVSSSLEPSHRSESLSVSLATTAESCTDIRAVEESGKVDSGGTHESSSIVDSDLLPRFHFDVSIAAAHEIQMDRARMLDGPELPRYIFD